mmetsp:Transcript_34275/g.100666  ORF Transcript_34275/g.100666 Transcript_34275/m.100666 type:complete len:237 (+) Transcript_34275:956-1666(+)
MRWHSGRSRGTVRPKGTGGTAGRHCLERRCSLVCRWPRGPPPPFAPETASCGAMRRCRPRSWWAQQQSYCLGVARARETRGTAKRPARPERSRPSQRCRDSSTAHGCRPARRLWLHQDLLSHGRRACSQAPRCPRRWRRRRSAVPPPRMAPGAAALRSHRRRYQPPRASRRPTRHPSTSAARWCSRWFGRSRGRPSVADRAGRVRRGRSRPRPRWLPARAAAARVVWAGWRRHPSN